MMGHTDKATINKRRPLTPAMHTLLRCLNAGPMRWKDMTDSDRNRMRALMDRGYAYPDDDQVWTITHAGKAAL